MISTPLSSSPIFLSPSFISPFLSPCSSFSEQNRRENMKERKRKNERRENVLPWYQFIYTWLIHLVFLSRKNPEWGERFLFSSLSSSLKGNGVEGGERREKVLRTKIPRTRRNNLWNEPQTSLSLFLSNLVFSVLSLILSFLCIPFFFLFFLPFLFSFSFSFPFPWGETKQTK